MGSKPRDVVDLIHSQHIEIASLFARVTADRGAAQETSFCDLRRLIAIHETAEQEVVYPILRGVDDEGTRIADARIAEEAKGVEVLSQLEDLDLGSDEFARLFDGFRLAVARHAHAEEDEVFSFLLRSQDSDRRLRMGELFDTAEKAAPTHPHPHAGTSATARAHVVMGPALTIIDHVRDALQKS